MPNPVTNLPADEKNRPWYQRWTIVFGLLTGGLAAAEQTGVVSPGTTEATATSLGQIVTSFLTLIGLYRQVSK